MKSYIILILFVFITFVSCNTTFKTQVYQFQVSIDPDVQGKAEIRAILAESDVKSITLKNDSILQYWKRYGGISIVNTIKYKLSNNELILDSIDIYGNHNPVLSNIHFLYSVDSLINKRTNERYYNQRYLNKIRKKIHK